MVEAIALSLKEKDDSLEKAMKTLTPKGVFIGFPIGLINLSPLRAWVT